MAARACTQNAVWSLLLFGLVLLPGNTAHAQVGATTASATSTLLEISVATSTQASDNDAWYASDFVSGEGIDQGDFVVGPGRVEVILKPGETVTREITLTNRISEGRTFEFVVEDVTGGVNGASVQFLGSVRGPYTLKDYISFPRQRITLALGERARIPVTISIPPDAEPGGKYGGVFITTVRNEGVGVEDGMPGARSPVIARIGVLFFVTVPGDITYEGKLTSLGLIRQPWWYEKGPIEFGVSYENTGSVHLNPYGEVRITNMFGEEVGFLELSPWFVLPRSLRTREISWDREFLLGRYTATALINRGYQDEDVIDEYSVTFWVLPWKIVGSTFAVIFVLVFLLRTFFRRFEFKRRS